MSVAEIAQKLHVPHATVRNYFKGRLPATEILAKIANETGVSLTWLLTNQGPQWAAPAAQPGGENESLSQENGSEHRVEAVSLNPERKGSEDSVVLAHLELIITQNNRTIELNNRTVEQNNQIIQLLQRIEQKLL